MERKPLALANWKMAMTVDQGLTYVRTMQADLGGLLNIIDLVICPPATALWPLSQHVRGTPIALGGQNLAPTDDSARTGEISADLLADAGCQYVMLGHWETRRYQGDTDETINAKVHLALKSRLIPILFVGEAHDQDGPVCAALEQQLATMLRDCRPERLEDMVIVYEPESAIGQIAPPSPEHVCTGYECIRNWLSTTCGPAIAESIRIIYGGSVTPEHALQLLECMDGLGATRRGRDAAIFADIVRQIAYAKGGFGSPAP